MLKNYICTALLSGVLLLAACGSQGSQETVKLKMGVLAPLTGNAAELGEHIRLGIDLANEHLGDKYDLIYEDDKCIDTKAALNAAQKFIDIDKTKFVLGPLCAPPYQAVSGLFNRNGVAFVHTSGATPAFAATAGDYGIPGFATSTYQENEVLAKFIYNELGIRKMAVFVWNEEWAVEHEKGFVKQFTALGGEIVFDEKFEISEKDFRTMILKIKKSGAEGVFAVALNFQNGELVKQLRLLAQELPIFGQFEIEDPAFLDVAGEAADGVMYAYPRIYHSDPQVQKFFDDYMVKHGKEPNYYDLVGYDVLMIFDWAIEECNADSACVVGKILSVKNYPGVSGVMNFDENKMILREFEIRTFKGGRAVVYT